MSGFANGAPRPSLRLQARSSYGAIRRHSTSVTAIAEPTPNVSTGCSSQVRACCRKSLICIRPVDRYAGRGLDRNTHAPLISLADRRTDCRAAIRGASDSGRVPCRSSIANLVEIAARSPRPRDGHRRPCRDAARSRRCGRAYWPALRRALSVSTPMTMSGAPVGSLFFMLLLLFALPATKASPVGEAAGPSH
jgi:hypothetical protein